MGRLCTTEKDAFVKFGLFQSGRDQQTDTREGLSPHGEMPRVQSRVILFLEELQKQRSGAGKESMGIKTKHLVLEQY